MANFIKYIIAIAASMLLLTVGCEQSNSHTNSETLPHAHRLVFTAQNASNAFNRVSALIAECTPRDAGTESGFKAAEWLFAQLKNDKIQAKIDTFDDQTPQGVKRFANVIGEKRGGGCDWIVLLSHFDTKSGIDPQFQGANDSGSSTGLLLELASIIQQAEEMPCNFLFGFMDGEECMLTYSENDGLHGSRDFARKLKAQNTRIRAVILMDMIGDRDLKITIPHNSTKELKLLALKAAEAVGHREKIGLHSQNILDDHQPFLDQGYPAINLIDFHFGSRAGFNDYWHTLEDSMEKISTDSLYVTVG
jgi:glutaminyl-peptide cyclotransferase